MKLLLHPAVEPQLDALIASGRTQTLLLHGRRGVGKRTVALEIARRRACLGCDDGSCRSCKMAVSGNHPNITTVMPDEKGKIGIEAVHELQHGLLYRQYEAAGGRTMIIAGAETLTLPAQNALLKTLEEPPEGTLIILTSTSPTSLLTTVVSRCRQIYLPPVRDEAIAAAVGSAEAARASGGLPGRAQTLAQDPKELATVSETMSSVEAFLNETDMFARLTAAAGMASSGTEPYLEALVTLIKAKRPADLPAVESLRRRIKANVSAKTAFEALAVELT